MIDGGKVSGKAPDWANGAGGKSRAALPPIRPGSAGLVPHAGATAAVTTDSVAAAAVGGPMSMDALEKLNSISTSDQAMLAALDTCGNEKLAAAARQLWSNDPELHSLSLRHCGVTDDQAILLADALMHNKVCSYIDLRDNRIGHIGGLRLSHVLLLNTTITTLFVTNNNISGDTLVEMRDRLAKNNYEPTFVRLEAPGGGDPSLTALDMGAKNVGKECCKRLCNALRGNRHLRELGLKANDLAKEGAAEIAALLTLPPPPPPSRKVSLVEEKEEEKEDGEEEGDCDGESGSSASSSPSRAASRAPSCTTSPRAELAPATATAAPRRHSINILEYTGLDDSGNPYGCRLASLDLDNNGIGEEGLAPLCEALRGDSGAVLEALHLGSNELGPSGALIVAEVLRCNRCLRELDLQNNGVLDAGAVAVADALTPPKKTTALLEVARRRGRMRDGVFVPDDDEEDVERERALALAVQAAADAGGCARTLLRLNLRGNGIRVAGAKQLGRMLAHNTVLQSLKCRDNSMGIEGGTFLMEALADNYQLLELTLLNNGVSDHIDDVIKDRLARNGLMPMMATMRESRRTLRRACLDRNDALKAAKQLRSRLGVISAAVQSRARALDARAAEIAATNRATRLEQRLLSLAKMEMGDFSCVQLMAELAFNRTVRTLNMEGNSVGAIGAGAIGDLLRGSGVARLGFASHLPPPGRASHLTALDLSSNRLGDEGLVVLAGALCDIGMRGGQGGQGFGCTLRSLALAHNDIGARGAHALALAIDHGREAHRGDWLHGPLGPEALTDSDGEDDGDTWESDEDGNFTADSIANSIATSRNHDGDCGRSEASPKAAVTAKTEAAGRSATEVASGGGGCNASLAVIDISGNKLADKGAIFFMNALRSNRAITSLDLTGNAVSKPVRATVADRLARNRLAPTLRALLLRSEQAGKNAIAARTTKQPKVVASAAASAGHGEGEEKGALAAVDGDEHPAPALAEEDVLARVDVDGVVDLQLRGIGNETMAELARCLATNEDVTSLDVRSNAIGDPGVKHLIEALSVSQNRTLTAVRLAGNGKIANKLTYVLADRLGRNKLEPTIKAVRENDTTLTAASRGHLDLKMRNICHEGFARLAEALEHNGTVTAADLSCNDARDLGAAALVNQLLDNECLLTLNLADNHVGPEGGADMAMLVQKTGHLTSLSLRTNQLGDKGAGAMAAALPKAKTLKTLDLSQNAIADFGTRQLAEALQHNSVLTMLELEGNSIGDAGATDLAKALEVNSTLGVLRLQSNPIGTRGEGWLAQATGGFNHDREIFLRAFDPSTSFTFDRPLDELTAKVRGPGGAVTNELDDLLVPTIDEFARPEPGSEAADGVDAGPAFM